MKPSQTRASKSIHMYMYMYSHAIKLSLPRKTCTNFCVKDLNRVTVCCLYFNRGTMVLRWSTEKTNPPYENVLLEYATRTD